MKDFFKVRQFIIKAHDESEDINDKPPFILIKGKKTPLYKVESLLNDLLNIWSKSHAEDIIPLPVSSSADSINKASSLID